MPPNARRLVGLLTFGLLVWFGVTFLRTSPVVGALFLALAAFRGSVLAREWRSTAPLLPEKEPAEHRPAGSDASEPDDDVEPAVPASREPDPREQ